MYELNGSGRPAYDETQRHIESMHNWTAVKVCFDFGVLQDTGRPIIFY